MRVNRNLRRRADLIGRKEKYDTEKNKDLGETKEKATEQIRYLRGRIETELLSITQ